MTLLPPGATRLPSRPDPYATPSARAVWVEVIERRREWARQAGEGHFEGVPAYERQRWLDELDDAVDALSDAMEGRSEVDPRKAAIDVMAVVSALVDVMGGGS